jgi:CPA2 family monovalent cation:H+ antiporter-2
MAGVLLGRSGLGLKLERIAATRTAVLTTGIIDLNVNMLIGFVAAPLFGFTLIESAVIAVAFYISSTAMAVTSLIENRKLMLREAETVIWLIMFEDLVLIVFLAIVSAANHNTLLLFLKIAGVLALLYALAHRGKEFLISILDRDDELPILFTFAAVLTTATFSKFLEVPETMMVIALGAAFATIDPDAFEQQARPFKDGVSFLSHLHISVDPRSL